MLDKETYDKIQLQKLQNRRKTQKKLVLEDGENRVRMRWSKEEIDFLETHKETMTHFEIGYALGRTLTSVDQKIYSLNKEKGIKKIRNWTKEEDEFLIKNFREMNITEIALKIKRSNNAVIQRSTKLRRMGQLKEYKRIKIIKGDLKQC